MHCLQPQIKPMAIPVTKSSSPPAQFPCHCPALNSLRCPQQLGENRHSRHPTFAANQPTHGAVAAQAACHQHTTRVRAYAPRGQVKCSVTAGLATWERSGVWDPVLTQGTGPRESQHSRQRWRVGNAEAKANSERKVQHMDKIFL